MNKLEEPTSVMNEKHQKETRQKLTSKFEKMLNIEIRKLRGENNS